MTGVMDAAVEAAREAGATRLLGVKVSILSLIHIYAVARIGQFRGGSLCGLPSFCARASWGG